MGHSPWGSPRPALMGQPRPAGPGSLSHPVVLSATLKTKSKSCFALFSVAAAMNSALKAACLSNSSLATSLYVKAAFFHSSPVLERKRRTHWDSGGGSFRNSSKRPNNYSRRFRKMHAKHALLRNVSVYAECLFQSWQVEDHSSDPFPSKDPSSFKRQHWTKGTKQNGFGSHGPQWEAYGGRGKTGFRFCYGDDEDAETILQSAFGGERYSYWSFINDDYSQWRSSSSYSDNRRNSWNWRNRSEYTHEEDDDSMSESTSDRLALGLSTSGPLKLEDVKNAYRACALKWHPDRHQGSSKAVAEEKFKLCSTAYQSLCDKLEGIPGASYC